MVVFLTNDGQMQNSTCNPEEFAQQDEKQLSTIIQLNRLYIIYIRQIGSYNIIAIHV